jgi:hypothetical protein
MLTKSPSITLDFIQLVKMVKERRGPVKEYLAAVSGGSPGKRKPLALRHIPMAYIVQQISKDLKYVKRFF